MANDHRPPFLLVVEGVLARVKSYDASEDIVARVVLEKSGRISRKRAYSNRPLS